MRQPKRSYDSRAASKAHFRGSSVISIKLEAFTYGSSAAHPAQTGGDNSMSCWNWFRPGDQLRDSGEPAIISGLTESLSVYDADQRDPYKLLIVTLRKSQLTIQFRRLTGLLSQERNS